MSERYRSGRIGNGANGPLGVPDMAAPRPDRGLTEYLSQPCDELDCDLTATHNGYRREAPHRHGQWCNAHTSWDRPAFARND